MLPGRLVPAAAALVAAAALAALGSSSAGAGVPSGDLQLITEPQAGVAPILAAVSSARASVDLVMYEDTDQQVDAALVADERRGVQVRVLLNDGYHGDGFAVDDPEVPARRVVLGGNAPAIESALEADARRGVDVRVTR